MTDPEEFLHRLTPRGPDPGVSAAVRDAVARELAAQSPSPGPPKRGTWARWERRITWLTAAAVLFGIALNYVVVRVDQARRDRWLAFDPAPGAAHDVAKMVESASDAETGAWVEQRFAHAKVHRPPAPHASPAAFEQYIHLILKEPDHAPTQENPQVPRPDRGRPDRGGAHRQRDRNCTDQWTAFGAAEQTPGGGRTAVAA
jgi:hypothetical protein